MTADRRALLATYAVAVAHRVPWDAVTVTIDGRDHSLVGMIEVVLEAADGIGLLTAPAPATEITEEQVEAAARRLAEASGHVLYGPDGYGWHGVLTHLEHAGTAARARATDARTADQIGADWAVLRRYLQRGGGGA